MANRTRNIVLRVPVTPEERALIQQKMAQLHTKNFSAYARKMLIDGYIVHMDTSDIRAQTAELQKIGVNVNQIARRINSTGTVYAQDIEDIKGALAKIWQLQRYILEQYAELKSKVAEISAANDAAAAALKDVEHRLGDMAVLIKNLTTYKQLRPVVLEYRKAKDKAAFRREHESQLILYEAAAKAIKDAGITRLPDLAALKAEYRELDKQKARLYEQYGEVKRELKEYGIIKQNVDSILRVTPGKEQAQEL